MTKHLGKVIPNPEFCGLALLANGSALLMMAHMDINISDIVKS